MTDSQRPPPSPDGPDPHGDLLRLDLVTTGGERIVVRPARDADLCGVRALYDSFEPKQSAQGLPPAGQEDRHNWVQGLLCEPINALAEVQSVVVGHACLLDIVPEQRSELAIMIHQDWQNRGIGSALLDLTIALARRSCYRSIWLTVSVRNTRAIHVYRKCGFRQCDRIDIDIEMERLL